ncbi:HAD family acid phosphatase [Kitasatospora sp. DSM 101779]|uniref:HAD family acid phosphatase n=1 Tax=Kitasatospora sp. DSM 101779 TaxID=2853165 RepID=UPI0021D88B3F|nr:HAD family acid phosphatase [Kitasatospora sp. DSM 101779]MCU7826385.1 acid phosphatase [Kitasatospora sp. DSM 101779]
MVRKTLGNRSKTLATLAVGVVVGGAVAGGGFAVADTKAPRSDRQITNMTDEVNDIKAYYGDTVDAQGEHWASPTSNYAKQVAGIEKDAKQYLQGHARHDKGKKKAIVLDVDDTSLSTYNYELETTFVYTPASNAQYIATKTMPAVFGMNTLAKWAEQQGYTVFFVTGRPEAQRSYTAANLAAVGFPTADASHLYLKNKENPPAYLACGKTCTTIEYKSGTRAHIESLGYQIVANFGDQYSDLSGGHSGKTYKIPNPMYYLP